MWPDMHIIHGRPRHPQSQGCIERANGDLQVKLGKWLDENDGHTWDEGLPFITFAMNSSTSAATKCTPYEVVFGQTPRKNAFTVEALYSQGVVSESDMDDDMVHDPPQLPAATPCLEEAPFPREANISILSPIIQGHDTDFFAADCMGRRTDGRRGQGSRASICRR